MPGKLRRNYVDTNYVETTQFHKTERIIMEKTNKNSSYGISGTSISLWLKLTDH